MYRVTVSILLAVAAPTCSQHLTGHGQGKPQSMRLLLSQGRDQSMVVAKDAADPQETLRPLHFRQASRQDVIDLFVDALIDKLVGWSNKGELLEEKIRECTMRLAKKSYKFPYKHRTNKAIKQVKKFVFKQFNTKDVRLDPDLNKAIWFRGMHNPPSRIRLRMTRRWDNEYSGPYTFVCLSTAPTNAQTRNIAVDDEEEVDETGRRIPKYEKDEFAKDPSGYRGFKSQYSHSAMHNALDPHTQKRMGHHLP